MGNDGLDGVGVGGSDNGLSSGLSSDLDARHLVTNGGKDVRQESDEVGLNGSGDLGVLGDGTDGIEGALTGNGILLVAELLLQELNSPICMLEIALQSRLYTEHTWWGHQPPQCRR